MSAKPQDVDVVFKPWIEWHRVTEERKEAIRLLRHVLGSASKNEWFDLKQVQNFLDALETSETYRGGEMSFNFSTDGKGNIYLACETFNNVSGPEYGLSRTVICVNDVLRRIVREELAATRDAAKHSPEGK